MFVLRGIELWQFQTFEPNLQNGIAKISTTGLVWNSIFHKVIPYGFGWQNNDV